MGSALKRLRESTGLSAYAFAKEAGITGQYYWVLEQGRTNMQMKTSVRIAQTLAKLLDRKPGDVLAEMSSVDDVVSA